MLIRRFFSVLYLSAVIQSKKCLFYGEAYKGAKLLKTIKAEFDLDESGVVSERANEYIRNLQKEYKWVYLSLFFDALEQGAFEAKNADNLEKLGIKTKEITCINPTKNWLIYAKHSDVKAAEEKFSYGLRGGRLRDTDRARVLRKFMGRRAGRQLLGGRYAKFRTKSNSRR